MAGPSALLDRYELRALVAVAVQVLLLLAAVIYGLAPPSLGGRIVLPTLAMLPVWAGLAWLTLHRPWEWGGIESRRPLGRFWGYWEGSVVYGTAALLAWLHGSVFADAKGYAAELGRGGGEPWTTLLDRGAEEAWASDALGRLVLTDPVHGWWAVGAAVFCLALAWFLLPR